MVGRGEHDQMFQGEIGQLGRAVEAVDPVAHHRAAGGVGDAGEGLDFGLVSGQVAQGAVETTGDVVEGDLVVEADVLAEPDVLDVEGQAVVRGAAHQRFGQLPVGVGVGDAPAVHEDQLHEPLLVLRLPRRLSDYAGRCENSEV